MRPFIPVEISMRETADLQKSVAADLEIPDPAPNTIVTTPSKKSTKKIENAKGGSENSEVAPEHDAGSGSSSNNESV
jgi:hypothetical protein